MKNLLFAIVFVTLPVLAADAGTAGLEALRQAAEKGNVDAEYELGILYEFGYNFPEHKSTAYAWYTRAAASGNPLAAKRRDVLKSQLSAAEIDRSQTLLKSQAPGSAPSTPASAAAR